MHHRGFVGLALGATQSVMLYYRWAVFTFLERCVFIDLDEWPFFKRCAITSFGHGLEFSWLVLIGFLSKISNFSVVLNLKLRIHLIPKNCSGGYFYPSVLLVCR